MIFDAGTLRNKLARFFHLSRGTAPSASRDSRIGKMGRPVVVWPKGENQAARMACPNCGVESGKPLLLTIDYATLPGQRRENTVLRCPDCTCLFYETRIPPDYAEEAMLGRGRVPFYLQQGAGLSSITRPLAQLKAPAGAHYLEVGCGFGFGLDYAQNAKHWTAQGIDPAGLSALGREQLGVSIDLRYLGDEEPGLKGNFDVVMSSETLEHVVSPAGFVGVLRDMLRPDGTLVLSTPDGADLGPDTPPGIIIPLLSPGLHLIFQTEASLRTLLAEAGFRHVILQKDGHSLVAFASQQPLDLETGNLILRREYRTWLESRASAFPPGDDLFLAFAGRALMEAVNDSDFDQARRVRDELDRACEVRFHLPFDTLGTRAAEIRGNSLEEVSSKIPLSLGGMLYADALLRLATGEKRKALGTRFRRAAAGADVLRDALGDLAMEDGMTEDIAWTARAEELLCDAASGRDDIAERLAALPAAPDPGNGVSRRKALAERILVELVNAGHYAVADGLAKSNDFEITSWADPDQEAPRTDSERDALFCLAVIGSRSNDQAQIRRSRDRFRRVRLLLGDSSSASGLGQAAQRGEIAALERLGEHASAAELRGAAVNAASD
jgi:2-polyprenyl-3-methyl-5-hydroxy-6-metoxy-1,4-benzoquinol methylase